MRPIADAALFLPPQVCEMAQLVPGEIVQVQNQATGRWFSGRVQKGVPGAVVVYDDADPLLRVGDALLVVAGQRFPDPEPPPGACTYCYAERNQVVEIRDALSIVARPSAQDPASLPA